MTARKDDAEVDASAAGRAIYARLQSLLEATDEGSFVVIDAVSGDYEVDPSPAAARRRLTARQPAAELYERRIGWPASFKLVSVRQRVSND